MKNSNNETLPRLHVVPGDDIASLNATIGVQESTRTVVLLNREIIKDLMESTSCVTIRQSDQIAEHIIKLRCPDLEPGGWSLGTMTKELADYLSSFLVDKHKHETVKVGGKNEPDQPN